MQFNTKQQKRQYTKKETAARKRIARSLGMTYSEKTDRFINDRLSEAGVISLGKDPYGGEPR